MGNLVFFKAQKPTFTTKIMRTIILGKLDRIDQMNEKLFRELHHYPDELLNRKPGPGKWSVLQVLHHLMVAEKLSEGYVRKKTSSGTDFPNVPISSYTRLMLLQLNFLLPLKFKAPPAVGDDALPDTSTLAETIAAWKQNRQSLRSLLTDLPEGLLAKGIYKHPLAGKLNAGQMIYFFDIHFTHHLSQIERTLKAVG